MQLSQLVTSLETSQKLKALGVEQKSLFYWGKNKFTSYGQGTSYSDEFVNYGERSSDSYRDFITTCSAFTSSELGEMLDYEWTVYRTIDGRFAAFNRRHRNFPIPSEDNEAEARGKLYIYLKENNLV